ncbi:hypothetical protein BACSTE_00926 [Bacteroides stercoris ATCC 43183]|uniref:Uncharacterized protein n=1 Tax=Bacteroides stercoris ATCC 43183 TaxID=449673 RepID=B0NNC6_BACSE|nr:hypothetical protein BACSTE_00926 [Bacteroides stercoris ATCC 43183]
MPIFIRSIMVEQNVSRDGTQVSPWWNKNFLMAERISISRRTS